MHQQVRLHEGCTAVKHLPCTCSLTGQIYGNAHMRQGVLIVLVLGAAAAGLQGQAALAGGASTAVCLLPWWTHLFGSWFAKPACVEGCYAALYPHNQRQLSMALEQPSCLCS